MCSAYAVCHRARRTPRRGSVPAHPCRARRPRAARRAKQQPTRRAAHWRWTRCRRTREVAIIENSTHSFSAGSQNTLANWALMLLCHYRAERAASPWSRPAPADTRRSGTPSAPAGSRPHRQDRRPAASAPVRAGIEERARAARQQRRQQRQRQQPPHQKQPCQASAAKRE